jgi:hypothetical protein
MSKALGYETGRGEASQAVWEYDKGVIVLEPLSEETMMLVVSAEPDSVGRIRYMSKKYRQELIDALNAE